MSNGVSIGAPNVLSIIGSQPMHKRPKAGQQIKVVMKGSKLLDCTCTMVTSHQGTSIVIYHNGKAIDESRALGWWPDRSDASEG